MTPNGSRRMAEENVMFGYGETRQQHVNVGQTANLAMLPTIHLSNVIFGLAAPLRYLVHPPAHVLHSFGRGRQLTRIPRERRKELPPDKLEFPLDGRFAAHSIVVLTLHTAFFLAFMASRYFLHRRICAW